MQGGKTYSDSVPERIYDLVKTLILNRKMLQNRDAI